MAKDLHITGSVSQQLIMSIYVVGYAVGPFILGPLSEIHGRALVIQSANIIYLAFNTGCGFSSTRTEILAMRFLCGVGASAPQSVRPRIIMNTAR